LRHLLHAHIDLSSLIFDLFRKLRINIGQQITLRRSILQLKFVDPQPVSQFTYLVLFDIFISSLQLRQCLLNLPQQRLKFKLELLFFDVRRSIVLLDLVLSLRALLVQHN
jgi:hypothetical protein